MPNAIVSKLGNRFVANFYKGVANHSGSCVYIAKDKIGRFAGFIIGSLDRGLSYRIRTKKQFCRLILLASFRLFKPAVLLWLIKSFIEKIKLARQDMVPERKCELLVIAVQPWAKGTGLAQRLVFKMENFMRTSGFVGKYTILTEQDNEEANKFYRKIGAELYTTFLSRGRYINEYRKSIQ